MIQRIRPSEYLTDIQAMTEGERKDYLKRVGEWLAEGGRRLVEMTDRPMALSQNIVQLSTRWTADDCRAFREGTLLLTALVKVADTWLPSQLYARSANRAVRRIAECFGEAVQGDKPAGTVAGGSLVITEEQKQRIVEKYTKKAMEKLAAKEEPTEGKAASKREQNGAGSSSAEREQARPEVNRKATQAVAAASVPAGKPQGAGANHGCKAVDLVPVKECQDMPGLKNYVYSAIPPRPKHIDQYVHLLPKKTQERAAQYGPLMRDFEAARRNLQLLVDDPHSSDKAREQWAKVVAKIDKQVGDIKRELDAEWEKVAATGRIVMDDLGMAHLMESEELRVKSEEFAAATQEQGAEGPKQEAAEPAVAQQDAQQEGDDAGKPEADLGGKTAEHSEGEAEKRKPGRPAMTEEEKQVAAEKRAEEKAAAKAEAKKAEDDKRREYLKKWLRDTRTNPSDERRKQWEKNAKELLSLGGEMTESIRKAGEYYGAKLPNDNEHKNEKQ